MAGQKDKAKSFQYEFGGPIGAFFIIIGLPAVIYALYFLCNKDFCLQFNTSPNWEIFFSKMSNYSSLLSDEGFAIFLGWMIFHFLLERILPGLTAPPYGSLNLCPVRRDCLRCPFGEQTKAPLCPQWPSPVLGDLIRGLARASRDRLYGPAPPSPLSLSSLGADISHGPTNFLPALESFNSLPIYLAYDHYLSLISASVLFSLLLSIYL
jgi:hypothetical protein